MSETLNIDSLKRSTSLSNLLNSQPQMNSQTPTQSSPVQREAHFSIFTPRTRRFSASFSNPNNNNGLINPGPRLAPRISQLRQEECADILNVREVNHERETHSNICISQSYEDLTLVMGENWNFKNNDELTNPLHVTLPIGSSAIACSSPSPTSRHNAVRLPCGMSPSPTRRSFATRRSMSPIAMRPSPLGSVKRKFDMLDEANSCSSSSSQPFKRIFTENYSRGSSPIYQVPLSPLPICPSPDSSTSTTNSDNGRLTPKLFLTKLFNNPNINSLSITSSPLSTISSENDSSPSPSSIATIASSSKEFNNENNSMDVGSCTDSGVGDADASSDNGSELVSSSEQEATSNGLDSDIKSINTTTMIIEDEIDVSSDIPMNCNLKKTL